MSTPMKMMTDDIAGRPATDLAEPSAMIRNLNRLAGELVVASSLDELKAVHNKAEALRLCAKTVGANLEVQNAAAELRIRTERAAGVMLEEITTKGGERHKLHDGTCERVSTLDSVGITRSQSHRWQTIAGVPEDSFEAFIQTTLERGAELTSAGVYKLGKKLRAQEPEEGPQPIHEDATADLNDFIKVGVKFGTVYADPAWQYGNQATRASTDNHYQTMSVDEICALPVAELAAEDSHLHLWTTNAFLFDAKRVIEAWGYTYKSVMVWVKPQMGIGNYWRVSHEFLLLGVRGNAKFRDRGCMSWISTDRLGHSVKPEVFRSTIERVSPGPYLEMFARRTAPGWAAWGNQIERSLRDERSV